MEAKFGGDRESSVSVATMATFDVRSRSLKRSLPAEFRSTTRSERSPPNLSTSWGSLVRAQYRPSKRAVNRQLAFAKLTTTTRSMAMFGGS
jgi:hypothetical protein